MAASAATFYVMSFLNPFMLLGTFAIAIPIAIHLLNKRKYERVQWAAMRFLQAATEKKRRRLRIEDLLLLLLRCLIVALLALALARPAIKAASGVFGGGAVTAVIAIDNSYSMSATDGVANRFQNAKKAAEQIIDSLPSGSSVSVLFYSDAIETAIAEPTLDLNLARKTINGATLTDRSTNVLSAARAAIEILKKKKTGRRELYLIGDGQLTGWSELADIKLAMDLVRDDIGSHIILVGPEVKQNVGIADLKTSGDMIAVERASRFEVVVNNFGLVEARDIRVQLKVDGDTAPVDETSIESIAGGSNKVVSLFAKLRSPGPHSITASLAADRLPADDNRTIVVNALSKVRVLLVDGDIKTSTSKTGGFYLQHALLPIPPAEMSSYCIAVSTVSASDFDSARLQDFDVVIASDVSDYSSSRIQTLSNFVHEGGGFVVFPGPNVSASNYNAKLYDHAELLPAGLSEPVGQAGQEEKFFTLQSKNFEHPIASLWNDPASGSPAAAHFYRALTIAADAKPLAAVVMRYADGSPAVLEHPVGSGRVVLFTSTADTSWNDLATRPGIFVPLMYRVLGSIVSRQDEKLNIAVGQRFIFHPPTEALGREATTINPAKLKDATKVELRDSAAVLTVEQTSLAGAYDVSIAGDPPINLKFAVAANTNESHLEELTDAQLNQLQQAAQVVRWTPTTAMDQNLRTARGGSEMWISLAMAVLAMAVMEPMLGNFFSRPK